MRISYVKQILCRRTLISYGVAVGLMLVLAAAQASPEEFFAGFSAQSSMGRLDFVEAMKWNLCTLPPVSASILFMESELGVFSTYTVLRIRSMSCWYLVRFLAIAIANVAFFLLALTMIALIRMKNILLWDELIRVTILFPLHTILISVLCCGAMLVFSSGRAAVGAYLFIEGGLLTLGLMFASISPFLMPFWGMEHTVGDKWGVAVCGSIVLLAALTVGMIHWLCKYNPAANPQNK